MPDRPTRNLHDQPRYRQVMAAIVDLITSEELDVGDKLPGERDIARSMNVSQMTANRAIRQLVADGYLRREVGVGTFVISSQPAPPQTASSRIHVVLFGELGLDFVDRDLYLGALWRGITEEGSRHGCNYAFYNVVKSGELTAYAADLHAERDYMLLVTPPAVYVPEIIRLSSKSPVRYVVVGAHWSEFHVPYVDCDNRLGAQVIVAHLTSLGHTNIAIVTAWLEQQNTADRLAGYRDALEQAGIGFVADNWINIDSGDWTAETVAQHIRPLMKKNVAERPTAMFAIGYQLALGAKYALENMGFAIPGDVSLAGFDDSPSADFLHPPLTTVRQPLADMGRRAVQEVMKGKGDSRVLLPVEPIIRRSTSRVPSTS